MSVWLADGRGSVSQVAGPEVFLCLPALSRRLTTRTDTERLMQVVPSHGGALKVALSSANGTVMSQFDGPHPLLPLRRGFVNH